jgi:hypothetical protein
MKSYLDGCFAVARGANLDRLQLASKPLGENALIVEG